MNYPRTPPPPPPPLCSFLLTSAHALGPLDIDDHTHRDEVTVRLDAPQEASMWACFASCVRAAAAPGGAPDARWPREALLTQRVVCAVLQSARAGGAEVKLPPQQQQQQG